MKNLPNIQQLLNEGREVLEKESKERRKQVVPTYHVSSGGLYLETEQTTTAVCHRTALVRFFEIEQKIEDYKKLMFEGGKANEEAWVAVLSKGWKGTLKREEEIPVNSVTTNGTPIVGNPDIVLCNPDPVLGLELKCMSSYYTVRNVYTERLPSLPHLIQALHYSRNLNIPFELWYSSRVDFHIPYMDIKNNIIPSQDSRIEYNQKGQPKKFYCVEVGFALELRGDTLYFNCKLDSKPAVASIVNILGIKKFFDYCDFLRENKDLGPRPINLDATGKKLGYSKCDYCEFATACKKYEDKYDEWFAEVRQLNK